MNTNRDLLILYKSVVFNNTQLDYEVQQLHSMLVVVESVEYFSHAHEIIDINKYRIISTASKIEKLISQSVLKPFCFLSCKN